MGMGLAVAIAPLLVTFAIRRNDGRAAPLVMFLVAMLWLIGVATYRALSLAHERWRRKMLRRSLAEAGEDPGAALRAAGIDETARGKERRRAAGADAERTDG